MGSSTPHLEGSSSPSRLKVAIVGGGIAGLAVAISLLKHPGVNVQVYERTRVFQEIGASISLAPNGLRTLEKLGVENALVGDVCTRQTSNYPMIYRHWKSGEIIATDTHRTVQTKRHFTARFHRAHLHQALLENIPQDIIHMGKKIVGVAANKDAGVILTFEDNTTAVADICIGADGIHSNIHKTFMPEHKLHHTGWVALRSAFPASVVEGIEFPEDASHWIGSERSFFHSRLGKGLFTIVGGLHGDETNPEGGISWDDAYCKDALKELYKDWHPTVRALIEAAPYTRAYPNMAGDPLKAWVFEKRVTLVGDAAHTHGGAFAAGGSLAIDDAYAMLLALQTAWPPAVAQSRKPSEKELARFFRLYEATRKPHIDKILGAVHLQVIGRKPKIGNLETDEMLQERIDNRPDPSWISEHDVEATFRSVLRRDTEEFLSQPML